MEHNTEDPTLLRSHWTYNAQEFYEDTLGGVIDLDIVTKRNARDDYPKHMVIAMVKEAVASWEIAYTKGQDFDSRPI